jgi:hypothetical protein
MTMRRLGVSLLVVLVLALLLGLGYTSAVQYAAPDEALDLSYDEVSLSANIGEMVRKRQFALELSEDELSNLLKKKLAANPDVAPHAEVRGARFHLDGDLLIADVHVVYRERYDVGLTLTFNLIWEQPDLVARHVQTSVRSFEVPPSLFQLEPLRLRTDVLLPAYIGIRSVQFPGNHILIELRMQ